MNKIDLTQTIYHIGHSTQFVQAKFVIYVEDNGTKYNVCFGDNDGKLYVVIETIHFYKNFHHHSYSQYSVHFRRNFYSRDEGNRVFKALLKIGRPEKLFSANEYSPGEYNLHGVSIGQVAETLQTA